ncbi:MAG: signal peptidase II [Acidimicrobiales bacterium]|nr:signal peptidase II [Acidimicrobiales bacterium]
MHRLQTRRAVTSLRPQAGSALAVLGVAAGSVVLDQITKTIAEDGLRDGPINLILGTRFVLAYNSGAAFSVGSGRSSVFTVLASVTVVGLIGYALFTKQSVGRAVMFGLIIGGASGNLFDRLFRGNGGRVIDFMELTSWWPVFNVADMSLFFGIVLMLVLTFREERDARHRQ